MAGRAKENLPGGNLKYQRVYLKIIENPYIYMILIVVNLSIIRKI